jgi:hypothetical protein
MTIHYHHIRRGSRLSFWVIAACAAACQPKAESSGAGELPPWVEPPAQRHLLIAAAHGDVAAMRAHGWDVWRDLQGRWQGFERSDVVLGQHDKFFRGQRPFRHGDVIEAETEPVMFSVAFDPTAAEHIRHHHLASSRHLRELTKVPDFPRSAIVIKQLWFPVHRDRPVSVPIWDATPANADAAGNPPRTWPRRITIDPRGGAGTVPLTAFLTRTLGGDELAAARRVAHDPDLAAGDVLVLLAMHVTTKEIPDWVWATYWWHDRPDDGAFAAGRPAAITGAARHYLMDVAFDAESPREPDGSPHVCMNPWLEARFPGGLHSNCLTCHQRAAFGAPDYLPVTRATLDDDDPYFRGKTTTDFLWTLAFEAH